MTITELLAPIKERLDKATPGPWEINASSTTTGRVWLPIIDEGLYLSCKYPYEKWNMSNDCALVANAPTDLRKLIEVIEVLDKSLCEIMDPMNDAFKSQIVETALEKAKEILEAK